MLVVKAFNFASLSSKHLYKLKITHNSNAVKLSHVSLQDTLLFMFKELPCVGQDRKCCTEDEVAGSVKTRDNSNMGNSRLITVTQYSQ
jgi:hypothetical protein